MSEQLIKHEGIVCEMKDNVAKIRLINVSTCSSCHAKAACSVSEIDNKTIEVLADTDSLSAGDRVNVLFRDSLGIKALLLGYVFPFIVMFFTLFTAWGITENETVAGLAALLILLPYYLILFLYKSKLQKAFSFKLEKIDAKL